MPKQIRMMRSLIWVSLVLSALSACSSNSQRNAPLNARLGGPVGLSVPERQFSAGLEGITESYVRSVTNRELTIAGLAKLTELDRELQLGRAQDGRLYLASASGMGTPLDLPANESNRSWARFTDTAIKQAQQISPAIAALGREDIYEAIFDGYMSRLDKHSRYWTPKQAEVLWEQLLGFGGIGINLEFVADGIQVLKVIQGSPAERSGILEGDLIVGIDGISLDQTEPQERTLNRLRGEVGSEVSLSIIREGQPMQTRLVREQVVPQTVDAALSGTILYLEISGFSRTTPEDVAYNVLLAKRQAGQPLTGIILDVRDNPGGLLPASTIIADLFLTDGLIVSTKGRNEDANQEFWAEPEDISDGAPIVVLVNGNSASAAEILAAAIQDNKRGVVVGSASYGKGSVQTNIRLPNEGRMSVTLAEFFGPSGLPLNTVGVTPAVCTTSIEASPQQRLSFLAQGRLRSPLPEASQRLAAQGWEARESVRSLCPPTEALSEDDLTFARALLEQKGYYDFALGLAEGRAVVQR